MTVKWRITSVNLVINRAPVIGTNHYTIAQGATLNADDPNGQNTPNDPSDDGVLAGASDPDGDILSAVLVAGPSFASDFIFTLNGVFVYTHNGSRNFQDSFVYRVDDGNGGVVDSAVVITITEVNAAPELADDVANSAIEDTNPVRIPYSQLLSNDSPGKNESDQILTIIAVTNAIGGTVSLGTNEIIFVLAPDFNGPASFVYIAQDNGTTAGAVDFKTASATVRFNVGEVNDLPLPGADQLSSIAEDSGPRTISVASLLSNDLPGPPNESDQKLTFNLQGAVGGSVTLSGTNVIFTPDADYNGMAGFGYTVTDDGTTLGISDPKTASTIVNFTITEVNDQPAAVDDDLGSINEDSGPRTIPISMLLANDSPGPTNELDQTLTIVAVTNAIGGSVSIVGANIIFTPATDFNGLASFKYVIQDNGTTAGVPDPKGADAIVSFTITAVNDLPTLAGLANLTINEDAGVQTVNLTGISAGGGETQTLTVSAGSSNPALIANPTVNYTSPNSTGTLTFAPTANQSGTSLIAVAVRDAGLDGISGNEDDGITVVTFTVTVNAVNDPPTIAAVPDLTIDEDAGLQTVNLSGISAGGGESQVLIVSASSSHPGLIPNPSVSYASPNTTAILSFTPVENQSGTNLITVTVRDAGLDGITGSADDGITTITFTVIVTEVNDPPVAVDDLLGPVGEDSGTRILISFASLLANDSAPEAGQILTITDVGELTGGTVSIAGTNILFTPGTNFNGTARFLYTIRDDGKTDGTNDFKTAEGIVTFEVTAVNDPPIAGDQFLAVDEDGSVLITLTGLDGDPEVNQSLTFAITVGPGHGTLSNFNAASGQLTYRPASNYNGGDTIQLYGHR